MSRDTPLLDQRILVLEDDYMIAVALAELLEESGAVVVGPFGGVPQALAAVRDAAPLAAALLDVNLRGETSYAVADALVALGVRVVLTTGHDTSAIAPGYRHLPRCEKPMTARSVIRALGAG